jgi:hypothetical protein
MFGNHRKAEPTVQLRQTDKDPTEKALFAFTGGAVLAKELGGGAGQLEKRNRLSSDRQIRIRQKRRFLPLLAEELGGGQHEKQNRLVQRRHGR